MYDIDPRIEYLIAGGSSIHGRGRLSFEDKPNKRKRTHDCGTRWSTQFYPVFSSTFRQEWVDFHYLKRSAKSCVDMLLLSIAVRKLNTNLRLSC